MPPQWLTRAVVRVHRFVARLLLNCALFEVPMSLATRIAHQENIRPLVDGASLPAVFLHLSLSTQGGVTAGVDSPIHALVKLLHALCSI